MYVSKWMASVCNTETELLYLYDIDEDDIIHLQKFTYISILTCKEKLEHVLHCHVTFQMSRSLKESATTLS